MTTTAGPRIGSLCSGCGGLDLAVQEVFGATTAWHAQHDPDDKHQYAAKILAHHWPDIPNHGDITTIDYAAVEPVDILTAGFPCQDVSLAGRRAGLTEGTRSGLWSHVARAIAALQPRMVVIENVRGLLSAGAHSDVEPCPWCLGDRGGEPVLRALGAVLGDLASLGFDASWQVLRASDVGACHRRERVFVLAWPATADAAGIRCGDTGPAGVGGVPAAAVTGGAAAPANADGDAPRQQPVPVGRGSGQAVSGLAGPSAAAPDSSRIGRREGGAESARLEGRSDAPLGSGTAWGSFAAAIARHERAFGCRAPVPAVGGRLSPSFVEWVMGLPAGHVTAVPGLSRNAQLKALGNGVVPAQAAAALRLLLARTFA